MKKTGSKTKPKNPPHSNSENFLKFDLQAILDNTNTSIWSIDKDYCLVYGNEIFHKDCINFSGRKIENGEHIIHETLPTEESKEWKSYYDRALNGEKFTVERKRNSTDNLAWSVYHFSPVIENSGKIVGASIFAHDITDKIHTENKLYESNKRFEEFVNMLPEAIFEMDENFNLTYGNQKAFDLFGYSQSDLSKGLDAFEMLIPEDREKAKITFVNRLKGLNPGTIEYTAQKKDGTKFPVLFHASSIFEKRKFKGTRGLIIDISERKQNEAKQEQLALMLDLAPSSIIIHDFEANILYANNKTFELYKYTKEEFLSLSLYDLDPVKAKKGVPDEMKKVVENGRANFQVELYKKDGTILPLEIFAVLTKWNDKDAVLSVGTDITERLIHETELRESEAKFKTITENSPDAIFLVNDKGNYVYANQAASDLLGYTTEELLKLNTKDIGGDDEASRESFQQVLKNQKYYSENKLKRKDGSLILVDINAIVLPNGLIYGSARDLTERKEVEIELQKSYQMLNKLTDMVPGVVFQYRLYPDGHFEFPYVSRGINEIYEATPEEIQNDPAMVFSRFHPSDYNNILEAFLESAKNQTLFRYEYRVILPTKGLQWRICEAKPELLNDGSTLWYGIVADITERKQVEEKLRAHETFLNDTQKIARLGTYKMDIVSGTWESSEILDKIFGINKSFKKNVEGWLSLIHPDWKETMNDYLINGVIGNKVKFNKEYKIIRKKNNAERWVHGMGRLEFDESGNPIKMIGTIQDITEVKTIQEELIKAKEKAEESDRLKSAFLANMSHEIRTPMNGILGFANLLKEPQLDGEDQKKYVEIIEKSGERMLSTINNIIDISKIEAGQIEVVNQEFNVSEKLDNLLQFFKPEADKKGIQLVVQNKLSKPEVKIKSDQEKITAIFTNLIKNALKFCNKGKIEFGCNRTGNFLEFYVKDTGKGIPSHRQEAIFERFIQADIEDKAANEGSGLGLTISKSYAELLGGKIWVESEKEKGSKFTFTVPFVPVTIPQTTFRTNASSIESKIRKLNILIVEDDSVSETLLKIMIDKIGKQIFSAKTGLDAVEICRQNPDIDLILMDIKMPFMNGYETTKKIREFNKNVKIIATTAFALAGDQEKALNSGCNGYLTKPIMRDRLNDLIAHHFS